MLILTENLIRLFEEEKNMIVQFKELTRKVIDTNNEIYNITNKLQILAGAEIIKFSRTDIGFKIEILNKGDLIDIHKTLVAISVADQDTKDFLNKVAIELKGKTKKEAKEIINSYKSHFN